MLNQWAAQCRGWFSHWKSRRKHSHRQRQDAAPRRALRLHEIRGATESETFARRIAYLRKIDPLVFEEMVLDAFQRQGLIVERGTRYSGDGGLDGKIFRDNHWIGIQCKRYKAGIKSEHVEQFERDLFRFGMTEGYFVHTGRTPSGVKHRRNNVIVLSGRPLLDFLIQ